MTTQAIGADTARAIARAGSEPEWLESWRLQGWEEYESRPLPDRVAHLWRYTEPDKFVTDKVSALLPSDAAGSTAMSDVARRIQAGGDGSSDLAGSLVQQDDEGASWALDPSWEDAGVVLCDLRTAVQEHPDLVREHLGQMVSADDGKFAGLNAAMFAGGVFLYVPKGVELSVPIHTLFRSGRDLSAVFPRTLVILEDGSSATLIDEYGATPDVSGNGGPPRVIAHSVTEGYVGKNARLRYVNVQNWGTRTRSHYTQKIKVERDGAVSSVAVGLGGLYNKADIRNYLWGANAGSEMIGVLFGDSRQHFDSHTEHVHVHGHTFSDLDFKVVLEDRARSAYTGLIRIELEAGDSEAYQENRNLLLDDECRAESIPELEILNEDVRCTHGATVGPIDEEQVYYLMTRGLTRRQAERAIVEGFFAPVFERIDDETLRQRLWSYVGNKLEAR